MHGETVKFKLKRFDQQLKFQTVGESADYKLRKNLHETGARFEVYIKKVVDPTGTSKGHVCVTSTNCYKTAVFHPCNTSTKSKKHIVKRK
jgi:hypothetical protein